MLKLLIFKFYSQKYFVSISYLKLFLPYVLAIFLAGKLLFLNLHLLVSLYEYVCTCVGTHVYSSVCRTQRETPGSGFSFHTVWLRFELKSSGTLPTEPSSCPKRTTLKWHRVLYIYEYGHRLFKLKVYSGRKSHFGFGGENCIFLGHGLTILPRLHCFFYVAKATLAVF